MRIKVKRDEYFADRWNLAIKKEGQVAVVHAIDSWLVNDLGIKETEVYEVSIKCVGKICPTCGNEYYAEEIR